MDPKKNPTQKMRPTQKKMTSKRKTTHNNEDDSKPGDAPDHEDNSRLLLKIL